MYGCGEVPTRRVSPKNVMRIFHQLLLFLRPLLRQLTIEPLETAAVLGVDVGQAPLDESQSKLKWGVPLSGLLKQFGIESSINVVLMGRMAISLECRDQSCYPGGKNNQITGTGSRRVGVWHPRWHKDCGSGTDVFGSVGVAEG